MWRSFPLDFSGLKPNLPSQEVDKSKEMPELPDYIRQAIFGETPNKQAAYDKSLHRYEIL